MNRFDSQWQKLIVAARQAPADPTATAPYGFATRIAAQAVALPATSWLPLERFAFRGLLLAATCGIGFVPGVEVLVDQLGMCAHVGLLQQVCRKRASAPRNRTAICMAGPD